MARLAVVNGAPLCLAIESATRQASVALVRGEQILAHETGPSGQHHSESLLPMVDRTLAEAGVGLAKVDAFAISVGPGAFTSLRIGMATLKGLAFGGTRPVAAVSTLRALALSSQRAGRLSGAGPVIPLLDARRDQVYAAAYSPSLLEDRNVSPVLPVSVYDAPGLARAMAGGGHLVGEGAKIVAPELAALRPGVFAWEESDNSVPDAVSVALLGRTILAAGEGVPAASLVPRYVRRAEAEVVRTAEEFE